VPLIEIVSEPDIRSAVDADAYLTRLRQILMYAEVCDGNMEEGSLRCDANVSVRRPGAALATRTEVTNVNSFRFLRNAIDFEIERQIKVLESGGTIVQETRLFDATNGETRPMRSKEEAHDYRYFDEPDLLPLAVDRVWIEATERVLPEMPHKRAERYARDFGLPVVEAEALVATRGLADYFEAAATKNARAAANWVRNEVLRVLNEGHIDITDYRVKPQALARLIAMIDSGTIGSKVAKEVFEEMSATGDEPAAIVGKKSLTQISDPAVIRAAALRVIERNGTQVADYRAGKTKVLGFLVGQLMKELRGRANAEMANDVLKQLIDESATSSS